MELNEPREENLTGGVGGRDCGCGSGWVKTKGNKMPDGGKIEVSMSVGVSADGIVRSTSS
jgi:hypothetical protein